MEYSLALGHLRKTVSAIHPLQDHEWEAFASPWVPLEAKRKTMLTRAGDTERYLYFVAEGIQRGYYATPDGREATIVFSYPFSFGGIIDSFLLQTPSRYSYETLTQSHFLRCHVQQLTPLLQQYTAIQTMLNRGTYYALSGVLERLAELQCYSAEEKFRTLLKRSPHVLQLIPHKYLANYLGIDPTTFSKLLGTVRL